MTERLDIVSWICFEVDTYFMKRLVQRNCTEAWRSESMIGTRQGNAIQGMGTYEPGFFKLCKKSHFKVLKNVNNFSKSTNRNLPL